MSRTELRRNGPPTRTIVITGASAGIGRACVREFARRGYDVALLARGRAGLDGAKREVEACGQRALAIETDVSDADAVFAAADRVAQAWGHIDVWLNDAMVTVFGPVDAIPPSEFRRVTEVTYLGVVHGTLAALRHMRPRNFGAILHVGSALSYRAIPLQAPYCAAKFAIRGFTDSLRCELIRQRSAIRLCMVQLPGVNTPQFDWSRTHMPRRHRPIGGVYQPESIARAIADAAETTPREAWVGKPAILAILSAMIAPGLGDRRLAATAYAQQMDPDVLPYGGDILLTPAPVDHGARGRFDAISRTNPTTLSGFAVRGGIAVTAIGAALGMVLLGRMTSRSRPHGASPRRGPTPSRSPAGRTSSTRYALPPTVAAGPLTTSARETVPRNSVRAT